MHYPAIWNLHSHMYICMHLLLSTIIKITWSPLPWSTWLACLRQISKQGHLRDPMVRHTNKMTNHFNWCYINLVVMVSESSHMWWVASEVIYCPHCCFLLTLCWIHCWWKEFSFTKRCLTFFPLRACMPDTQTALWWWPNWCPKRQHSAMHQKLWMLQLCASQCIQLPSENLNRWTLIHILPPLLVWIRAER